MTEQDPNALAIDQPVPQGGGPAATSSAAGGTTSKSMVKRTQDVAIEAVKPVLVELNNVNLCEMIPEKVKQIIVHWTNFVKKERQSRENLNNSEYKANTTNYGFSLQGSGDVVHTPEFKRLKSKSDGIVRQAELDNSRCVAQVQGLVADDHMKKTAQHYAEMFFDILKVFLICNRLNHTAKEVHYYMMNFLAVNPDIFLGAFDGNLTMKLFLTEYVKCKHKSFKSLKGELPPSTVKPKFIDDLMRAPDVIDLSGTPNNPYRPATTSVTPTSATPNLSTGGRSETTNPPSRLESSETHNAIVQLQNGPNDESPHSPTTTIQLTGNIKDSNGNAVNLDDYSESILELFQKVMDNLRVVDEGANVATNNDASSNLVVNSITITPVIYRNPSADNANADEETERTNEATERNDASAAGNTSTTTTTGNTSTSTTTTADSERQQHVAFANRVCRAMFGAVQNTGGNTEDTNTVPNGGATADPNGGDTTTPTGGAPAEPAVDATTLAIQETAAIEGELSEAPYPEPETAEQKKVNEHMLQVVTSLIHDVSNAYDKVIADKEIEKQLVEAFRPDKEDKKTNMATDLLSKEPNVDAPVLFGAIDNRMKPLEKKIQSQEDQIAQLKKANDRLVEHSKRQADQINGFAAASAAKRQKQQEQHQAKNEPRGRANQKKGKRKPPPTLNQNNGETAGKHSGPNKKQQLNKPFKKRWRPPTKKGKKKTTQGNGGNGRK